jgi:hypothetical protein
MVIKEKLTDATITQKLSAFFPIASLGLPPWQGVDRRSDFSGGDPCEILVSWGVEAAIAPKGYRVAIGEYDRHLAIVPGEQTS